MSRIYSATNRIKFTDIPEKYAIPRTFKATLSNVHSAVVTYVFEHYRDSKRYRQQVVDVLNRLTFCVMQNEPPGFEWSSTNPIDTMPDIDLELVESQLGDIYLVPEAIEWDVQPTDNVFISSLGNAVVQPVTNTVAKEAKPTSTISRPITSSTVREPRPVKNSFIPTPKEDLYIQPPKCPRFDVSKVWMSAVAGNDNLVIYTTLPEIPTRQNEISITTNVESLTTSELLSLYPNHIIHTRAPQLYERYEGVDYDEDLGCVIPISGFSKEQVIDNLIKYPHLYRLQKVGENGLPEKFINTIEINGELLSINDVWDTLPESKLIPRDPEFVKEYVIRRYLLEEELGVKHQYQMVGLLEPFLTLFMPPEKYIERGYTDTISIARKCVVSRVHYKQSRSPILRRIEKNNA